MSESESRQTVAANLTCPVCGTVNPEPHVVIRLMADSEAGHSLVRIVHVCPDHDWQAMHDIGQIGQEEREHGGTAG